MNVSPAQATGPQAGGRRAGAGRDAVWAFHAMTAAFDAGECPCERHFAFAGRPVRLRALGMRVAEHVSAAFSHLHEPDGRAAAPRLSIDLWSEEETGIPCPLAPVGVLSGPVLPFEDGAFWSSAGGRYVVYQRDGATSALDRKNGRLVAWWRRSELRIEERAKPLSQLLAIWHNDCGLMLVHAALVSAAGRGVLLAGPSGAGKSTAALACLCQGFDYLGDDYVGLELRGAAPPVGHALYSAARVTADQLRRLPLLEPYSMPRAADQGDKSLVLTHKAFPDRVRRSVPIHAVVLPAVADVGKSRVCGIGRGRALLRFAYSTLRIPPSPVDGLDRLGSLLDMVPVCRLEIGRDLANVPSLLRRWLGECAQ